MTSCYYLGIQPLALWASPFWKPLAFYPGPLPAKAVCLWPPPVSVPALIDLHASGTPAALSLDRCAPGPLISRLPSPLPVTGSVPHIIKPIAENTRDIISREIENTCNSTQPQHSPSPNNFQGKVKLTSYDPPS
ncbi:hypothetical protein EX30DRAFT_367362 [Ascodesmis nigricans]|uniref:Uncharacterized protein n=1 Tax=Ascodesmis nigricans TaxID=341454 RepID=A0A4S2MHZ5_9PEZI|nr:hypothetical protein EX30DRAFT_367362 [Ascodesmis nigricans]